MNKKEEEKSTIGELTEDQLTLIKLKATSFDLMCEINRIASIKQQVDNKILSLSQQN